jgi:hypothetical protein
MDLRPRLCGHWTVYAFTATISRPITLGRLMPIGYINDDAKTAKQRYEYKDKSSVMNKLWGSTL